ncbi:MAG: restriction endonuclease subunit S [Flectobacillus sp.]|uniref:restriction endonuclease subunit S n=1 Tax=Flectobacillus sp. TaxID=50419 RepID=UPI003B9BDEF6
MMWEKVKIKDITINLDNRRKPLNEQERNKISKKKLYPYIGANNIMDYVDEYLFDEEIICIAEDGGSWGENQKCVVYFSEKCWVNNHAHVLSSNGKSDLKYLMYYLNAKDLTQFITGSTRGKLTKSALDSIQIPLPPLPIQKRIAEILDTADALRRKDEALLKKYDELAQAIFIDMFGDPVKNEKGWEVKKLGDLFKSPVKCGPFGSALKREEFVTFGIPVWNMDNIINYKFSKQCNLFIDDKKYQDLKSYSTQNGDIIISRAGTVGKMCVVDTDIPKSIISTNLIKISLDSNQINPFYFTSLMKYFGKKIGRLRTGSDNGFTHMNTGVLEGLVIPVPPIIQQNVFLEVLKNIECQCQDITFKSENLFNSLLQKAFNGELVA